MTAKRIPALTALTGAATANDDDLVIFDTSANETKRISRVEFFNNIPSNFASKIVISNKTGTYTVIADDFGKVINCTSSTFTVSLTAAATLGAGFHCWIWNTSAGGVITIDPNASETIDGVSTLILRIGEGVQVICDGTNWQTGSQKEIRGYAENLGSSGRPTASGASSHAIGDSASATNSNTLSIGSFTTASATSSTAIGVSASATTSGASALGRNAQAVGTNSVSLGNAYTSGTDSFAASIATNTSSYGAKGASGIALGNLSLASTTNNIALGNTALASVSGAVALGASTTASSTNSVAIGNSATASGSRSIAIGSNVSATRANSVAVGYNAVANIIGEYTYAGTVFSTAGDAQTSKYILLATTSNATPTLLTADLGAAGVTNQIVLSLDSTLIFRGQLVARNTGSNTDSMVWEFRGAARCGLLNSTTLIGTPSIDLIASDGSPWSVAVAASTSQDAVRITVTGEAGKTIRWIATVDTTEVVG